MEDNLPEKPKNTDVSAGTAAIKNQRRAGPGWIVWGLTALLAAVGTGAGWHVWKEGERHQQHQQQLQASVTAAITRANEQSEYSRSLQRELDHYNDLVQQQQQQIQQKIQELQQQISSQQKRILSLSTTDRNDWLLAEAEYLIRLANQRLLMGKEIDGAQDLLKAADDIIRELDDHALYPVRQALAEEIAALHFAARFDLEGLYLKLGATANQASQLRLLTPHTFQPVPVPVQAADNWQHRLQSGFKAAVEKLSGYVQIHRRDDIYKPILAPEYEVAVRQNVQLMFEQSQMALLSGNQLLYERSLGKAKDWLNTYYTLDKEATASVVTAIGQLEQQKVTITAPDISGSLRALKHYVEILHFTTVEKPGEAKKIDDNATPKHSVSPEENASSRQAL